MCVPHFRQRLIGDHFRHNPPGGGNSSLDTTTCVGCIPPVAEQAASKCPHMSILARIRPIPAVMWPNPTQIWATQRRLGRTRRTFGQILSPVWANSAQTWSNTTRLRSNPVLDWWNLFEPGPSWPNPADPVEPNPKVAELGLDSVEPDPDVVEVGPKLVKPAPHLVGRVLSQAQVGRSRRESNPVQLRSNPSPKFLGHGPHWAERGPNAKQHREDCRRCCSPSVDGRVVGPSQGMFGTSDLETSTEVVIPAMPSSDKVGTTERCMWPVAQG